MQVHNGRKTLKYVAGCLFVGLVAAALYYAITTQMLVSTLQPVDPSVAYDDPGFESVSFWQRLIAPFTVGHFWEFWWRDFPYFSAVAFAGMIMGFMLAKNKKGK
ncbi:MAG: hypothetical protein LAT56_17895 [Wenzhouxiangella sp.]|nr:hypothetical protein [Wenzhouxiangella sp.]